MQHQIEVQIDQRGGVQRRDFLRAVGAAALCGWTDQVGLASSDLARRGMRCVLLWMEGGPSQFETLDPKSASGSAPSLITSVPGIHLSENLPHLARQMGEVALVRSLTSREGSHPRAQYLMHHGYLPMGAVKFPTLGSNISDQIGNAACELPSFVRIGGRGRTAGGAGFLDVAHDPLVVQNPERPPQNARPMTSERRFQRRLGLLDRLETDFARSEGKDLVATHQQLTSAASEMILSPGMDAFDLSQESKQVHQAYGKGRFAKGCLLARRLLESGVTFVEVTQNGWDTHKENHTKTAENCAKIDQPAARLLADLKERGMLDTTLVLWMGEFGRTPKLNPNGGRDHYPKAFSGWLAGAGVPGGQVIGSTDDQGAAVTDRPVTPKDLYQTIYTLLGIDPEYENTSLSSRPIKLVDKGTPVSELLG